MALPSASDIKTALEDVLKAGQNYSRSGFSLSRASLDTLAKFYKMQKWEALRGSDSGASFVFDFSRGGGSTEASEWGDD